ncbi:hypothetical protein VPNG_06951 [Cytospora leucostoma]|uniref:Calpain catalytic domain-containing protein n=1 Tax=Cytospora leucostoma TaxID=1230097 RepID=A0A423WXG6_9PEZI|nr:hypothetical protein VPNG_06951 [Cytospora leucostoma]
MSVTGSSISDGPPPRNSRGRRRRPEPQTPQQKVDQFWAKYKTKAPGKATAIIPQENRHTERAARRASTKALGPAKTTQQSYEEAAAQCRHKVAQIVKECRRVNQKYRDPHFDLEIDLKLNRRDCLDSLDNVKDDERSDDYCREPPLKDRYPGVVDRQPGAGAGAGPASTFMGLLSQVDRDTGPPAADGDGESKLRPMAVKRVVDIFDDPKFFIDGPTANDVRQGRDGDCWLMAALCTISNKPGLIERCCVAHDQEVGVYGFVFHRDGEWFSEIIDDKLYLTKPDYDEAQLERWLWDDRDRVDSEEAYRKAYQSNSGALNPNETWLPLLEKAYAKSHGDYKAIEGGYGGEGIEDLTGGVTSEIYTTDILDKEQFWKEELMKVNQDFLFGCSTGVWGRGWGERKGILELHAYSVLKAREVDGVRLVLLKNPWGKHEWKGAWSDGSKEWTPEWLEKMGHKFGDDGSFWISYDDLLKKYQAFDRTRLFGPEWRVASIWTTLDVPWTLDYHDTKFALSLARPGPVVLVCSQLDERYFKGLEGQYRFELSFRLHRAGEEDYVVRSQSYYRMNRSVNVELDLEAGEYVAVVKVDAQRDERIMPVEEVVRAHARERREKLLRIGLAYDLAHSKGRIAETPGEKAAREAYEKRKRERERRKFAKLIKKQREEDRQHAIRALARKRRALERANARAKAKAERRQARKEAKAKAAEEERKKVELEQKTKNDEKTENDEKTKNHEKGGDQDDKHEDASEDKPEDKIAKQEDVSAESKDSRGADKAQTKDDGKETGSGEEEHVKAEADIPSGDNVNAESVRDGESSTEPGDNTPASSTILEETPATNAEDTQDEEAYVTAAENEDESQTKATRASKKEEEPSTPKAPRTKSEKTPSPSRADKATSQPKLERVDIGVQTGPGLPLPPRMTPPPGYLHSSSCPPPPPPPRASFGAPAPHGHHHHHSHLRHHGHHPPPRGDLLYMPPLPPPHLRGGPYVSDSEGSGLSSDDDNNLEDEIDSVSEVSEYDIDNYVEASRVAAARAAKAASGGGGPGEQVPPPPGARYYEDEMDEFEKDPWNAVGVFGLRVYYKTGGDGGSEEGEELVKLRIERPNPFILGDSDDSSEDGGDEADDGEGGKDREKEKEKVIEKGAAEGESKEETNESQALDVDDSAKDAVAEDITSEEKREDREVLDSIEPEGKDVDDEKEDKKEVKKEEVDETSNFRQTDKTPPVVSKIEESEEEAAQSIVKKEEGL